MMLSCRSVLFRNVCCITLVAYFATVGCITKDRDLWHQSDVPVIDEDAEQLVDLGAPGIKKHNWPSEA